MLGRHFSSMANLVQEILIRTKERKVKSGLSLLAIRKSQDEVPETKASMLNLRRFPEQEVSESKFRIFFCLDFCYRQKP